MLVVPVDLALPRAVRKAESVRATARSYGHLREKSFAREDDVPRTAPEPGPPAAAYGAVAYSLSRWRSISRGLLAGAATED